MHLDDTGLICECPGCGRRNRLAYERLDHRQRCGGCRRELPPPGEPVEIADGGQFVMLTGRSALPVVVDFWAGWCGPCLMMAPELTKVAAAAAGRFIVAKVNTENLPRLAQLHRITSLPTLSLLSQGREIARIMGARPAQAVLEWLQNATDKTGTTTLRSDGQFNPRNEQTS